MHRHFKFNGGVYPPEHKIDSNQIPIVAAPIPPYLVISLHQNKGHPSKPIVKVGDRVLRGQKIAVPDGVVSVAVHAPTSGTVTQVGPAPIPHPSGLSDLCITMESDGNDDWIERTPLLNWREQPPHMVRDFLHDMGLVGYGGALFPSHLKLNTHKKLEILIVNGAECEPYITCDDRLMRERAQCIVQGIGIVRELLNAHQVLIGIEDNKPEAATAMRVAIQNCDFPTEVCVVPTCYPSGGAKQLIKLLTNQEIPSGLRSTELGIQCFNVATLYHIGRAVQSGEPVTDRIVTLTGHVAQPGNYEARLGTPLKYLLDMVGVRPHASGYIYGGPMMGFALPDLEAGLTKAGNCIIVKCVEDFPPPPLEMPCIRCGKCAEACPVDLQPMDLYWFARGKLFEKSEKYKLFDCIECGACAYVCPSSIRLVDYFRYSKSEIWAKEQGQLEAKHAKARYEFKQLRQEREKAERAARLTVQPKTKAPLGTDEIRNAKIQAAVARAAQIAKQAAPASKDEDQGEPH